MWDEDVHDYCDADYGYCSLRFCTICTGILVAVLTAVVAALVALSVRERGRRDYGAWTLSCAAGCPASNRSAPCGPVSAPYSPAAPPQCSVATPDRCCRREVACLEYTDWQECAYVRATRDRYAALYILFAAIIGAVDVAVIATLLHAVGRSHRRACAATIVPADHPDG